MSVERSSNRWHRVSAQRPCPACGKADWCSVSVDGRLAACRRNGDGAWKTKADKSGGTIYLHRLSGTNAIPAVDPPTLSGAKVERADAETLNRIYSALLAELTLTDADRNKLIERGLTDDQIDHAGYRSFMLQGRAKLASKLRDRFGNSVLTVPGFSYREKNGHRYLTIAGAAGLIVPIRDTDGRIVGLLVRGKGNGPAKYTWISSGKHGGPGPGAPVHVPLGIIAPCELVRITEGALKADVAYAKSGLPTLGLPGVSSWRPSLPVLRQLGVQTVRLAFDADAQDNPHVGRSLASLASVLRTEGFRVELERWSAAHKGIDDALAAGAAIEVVPDTLADSTVAEVLAEAMVGEVPEEPSAIDRLGEVLADGVEAFFRETELLNALAQVTVKRPRIR